MGAISQTDCFASSTAAQNLRQRDSLSLQKKSANATFAGFCWQLLAFGALASGLVAAQGLPDPTKPPTGFVDAADLKPGQTTGALGNGAANESATLVLQSVLLPKNGKPVAIISGKYLPVGASTDGWELRSVSESEVVLVQGATKQILRLTPLVTKTAAVTAVTTVKKKPAVQRKVKSVKKAELTESESRR